MSLTGDSILDLSDTPNADIDLGTITGDGTLTIVGYDEDTSIEFKESASTINSSSQIKFGSFPSSVEGNDLIPAVPEPSTYAGGLLLLFVGIGYQIKKNKASRRKDTTEQSA